MTFSVILPFYCRISAALIGFYSKWMLCTVKLMRCNNLLEAVSMHC